MKLVHKSIFQLELNGKQLIEFILKYEGNTYDRRKLKELKQEKCIWRLCKVPLKNISTEYAQELLAKDIIEKYKSIKSIRNRPPIILALTKHYYPYIRKNVYKKFIVFEGNHRVAVEKELGKRKTILAYYSKKYCS